MPGSAVRNIKRAEPSAIARLGNAGCATVHEAQGRVGLMRPFLRPIFAGARCAGSAVTILAYPGDNWMLHVAAELLKQGDVAVLALPSANSDGMFGELLATSYRAQGCVGLVTESGCRDIALLREMNFPVWSSAISAQGTVKETIGAVNVPIVCGGVQVRPGDVIVADDDGIVVVPRENAEAVASAAESREEKENQTRARLKAGELGLDIYRMRERLAEAGLKYIDQSEE
jgi:4-hydroxy-4-methyl-2-oxoglutarate aldolase